MKHEIPSLNTKKMLAETLLSLLQSKSLSKITVSEIVNTCQINRKTFYYHFTDVYALFEWYLEQEMETALNSINPLDINTCISFSMEYLDKNSYLKNCIDDPLGRDVVARFLNQKIYPAAHDMIQHWEQQYHKNLEANYREFLAKLLTNVTVLSLIDTINNKENIDREDMLLSLSDILQNSVEGFFQKL